MFRVPPKALGPMETEPHRSREEKLKKDPTDNYLEGEKKGIENSKEEESLDKSHYLPKSSYSSKGMNIRVREESIPYHGAKQLSRTK